MMKVIEGADVYFVDGDLLQAHIKAKEKAVARVCSIKFLNFETFNPMNYVLISSLLLLLLLSLSLPQSVREKTEAWQF